MTDRANPGVFAADYAIFDRLSLVYGGLSCGSVIVNYVLNERVAGERRCATKMYRWCEAMTSLDLSEDRAARRARKRAVVVQVEFAEADGTLPTPEGSAHYSTGDALLTGTEGERWSVAHDTFAVHYVPAAPTRAGKPGRYRKRPRLVWAKPMADAFDVTLDGDRGTLRGQPGDWLVQYAPSDFSVVSARVFAQTYELLD